MEGSEKKLILYALCMRCAPLIEYATEEACEVAIRALRTFAADLLGVEFRVDRLTTCQLEELLALADKAVEVREIRQKNKRERRARATESSKEKEEDELEEEIVIVEGEEEEEEERGEEEMVEMENSAEKRSKHGDSGEDEWEFSTVSNLHFYLFFLTLEALAYYRDCFKRWPLAENQSKAGHKR